MNWDGHAYLKRYFPVSALFLLHVTFPYYTTSLSHLETYPAQIMTFISPDTIFKGGTRVTRTHTASDNP